MGHMALSRPTLLVLFIASLMAALLLVGIFPPKTPRMFLNHRRAVASIRSLSLAEQNYAEQHPDAGFACNLSNLGEAGSVPAPRHGLIDRVLASGRKSSYNFQIECAQSKSQKSTAYTVTAIPTKPGTTGMYAFCTDQRGEIWYSENGSISDCLAKHKPIEQKYR
jgi:hypothetical protein